MALLAIHECRHGVDGGGHGRRHGGVAVEATARRSPVDSVCVANQTIQRSVNSPEWEEGH